MMNASNYVIDLANMESTFVQMRNSIEVAVKAALANTTEVVSQIMDQTGKNQMHVKTDGVEIVATKNKILVLSKDIKLAATMEDICDMDYNLSSFSLHKQTDLLNSILKLGYMFESGKLIIDSDFTSDGMILASLVLNDLNINKVTKLVMFDGCKICLKPNEVLIDEKLVYQNGVLYFNAYYCKVLIDLFSKMTNHKYDVLNGGKPFSNKGDIKEWPCHE